MIAFLKRYGAAIFGVLLLGGAIYVVQREFRSLSVAQVRVAMAAIPGHALWVAAGFTFFAYAVLAIYDRLGSIYAGKPASWGRSLIASFCGYSLAHNLGFAAVSGAAVRFRLYSAWGYTPAEIAKVIGFTSLTFGLGGMALGGLVLMMEPEVLPWFGANTPRWMLQSLAIPMWGLVVAYVLLSRFFKTVKLFGHELDLPGLKMALAQTCLATVDVAVTAAIFYTLLPSAEGLTFVRFVGIYLAAYSLGIFASVPGGLGVFDSAILIGLSPYMSAAEVIGALLVFRLYYYIIPLFIAGSIFAGFELSQRRLVLARFTAISSGGQALEAPAMAGLVALSGALLIFIGALPPSGTLMTIWASYSLAAASQFAASVAGSLLLVLAYGLARRLAIGWGLAITFLLLGGLIVWLRGEPWYAWVPFPAVAALLATMRGSFYRRSRLWAEPLSLEALVPLAAVAFCGITLALVGHRVDVHDSSWWEVAFEAQAPNALRFTVGLTAVLGLFGLFRLLRPARIKPLPFDAFGRALLAGWEAVVPNTADGIVMGDAGRAGVAFSRRDPVWLAYGDPSGEFMDRVSAIWRFRDACERAGVRPVFWDVGPEWLRIYADIGLTAVPMTGQPGRFIACRAEQDLDRLLDLA